MHDLAYTAAERRNQHEHRLGFTARSKVELIDGLDAFVNGDKRIGMSTGIARNAKQVNSAGPVFIFSGMGPQFWNMGRALLASEPVFRGVLERCDALWQKHCDWSLIDALMASETGSRMDQTAVAQPTNFALQVALAEVWRAWGITPSVIVGHSAGEVAAAHVAGMLSLEDAVKVIFDRSRLQQLTAGEGSMAAVGLSLEDAQAALNGYEDRVSIAAINSPSSVTLSGDAEAIAEIVRGLSTRQVFARMLAVPRFIITVPKWIGFRPRTTCRRSQTCIRSRTQFQSSAPSPAALRTRQLSTPLTGGRMFENRCTLRAPFRP